MDKEVCKNGTGKLYNARCVEGISEGTSSSWTEAIPMVHFLLVGLHHDLIHGDADVHYAFSLLYHLQYNGHLHTQTILFCEFI